MLVNKVFEGFIKLNLNTKIPENEPKTKTQKVLKADKIDDPSTVQSEAELSNCTTGVLNQFCKNNTLKQGGNKSELIQRVWRFIQGKSLPDDKSSLSKTTGSKSKGDNHLCSGVNAKGEPCGTGAKNLREGHWFCWRHVNDYQKFITTTPSLEEEPDYSDNGRDSDPETDPEPESEQESEPEPEPEPEPPKPVMKPTKRVAKKKTELSEE